MRQEQAKVTVQRFCQHVAPCHQGKAVALLAFGANLLRVRSEEKEPEVKSSHSEKREVWVDTLVV